jgi:branched-chain amino acid transport system substrate-binding protein
MTPRKKGTAAALLAAVVAVVAMAAVAGGAGAATAQQPIVIGWAFDSKGGMAPFDGPALAAANIRIKQVNAKGGVRGRQLKIVTCDTQGNKPAIAKSCAAKLLGQGADIIFTTCDVDLAAPVVQEAINRGVLAVAPCIGTDQMGPKRFGKKGRLAFTFGNVAQDEGSAMAEYAWRKGWRTASLATDTVIVYFKNVVQAFEARWKQLGGEIVAKETYQSAPAGGGNAASWQAVTTRLNAEDADVIVTATAPPWAAMPTILNGLRSLGNDTPMLNSWAGDGTYWTSKDAPTSNYYFVTYASVFGDDPFKAVNTLAKQVKAGTGGFVTGAAAIDGVATAIRRAKSTQGLALAAQLEKFNKVPTISGLVSFSPSLHAVFGRQYRVVQIQDNKAKVVGTVVAKVVPKI